MLRSFKSLYNLVVNIKSLIAIGAGIIIGILATLFVGSLMSSVGRHDVYTSVGWGFGGGFGAVAAIVTINKLVGYLDRLASGKA